MNNSFEKQIKDISLHQKPVFENKEAVWSQIESKSTSKKHWMSIVFNRYAAVFMIGIIVSSIWFATQNKSDKEIYFNNLYESVLQTEKHYNQVINTQYQEVLDMPENQKLFFKDLFDEINELDEIYEEQKEELIQSGFSENVFKSMVETQQLKLEILNVILIEFEKINHHENKEISI